MDTWDRPRFRRSASFLIRSGRIRSGRAIECIGLATSHGGCRTTTWIHCNDDQIKISGLRVDLNEVRHAVLPAPGDPQLAMRLFQGDGQRAGFVAYCVLRKQIAAPDLRRFAAERYVRAAVPAAFVYLDALPLTVNGKVDARALPTAQFADEPTGASPRTHTEIALAGMWCRLLRLPRVGVDGSFFEYGGDSLLAMGLLRDIETAFGLTVPVATLFRHPTVESLAAQ